MAGICGYKIFFIFYRSRRQTLTASGEEQEREKALKYGGL